MRTRLARRPRLAPDAHASPPPAAAAQPPHQHRQRRASSSRRRAAAHQPYFTFPTIVSRSRSANPRYPFVSNCASAPPCRPSGGSAPAPAVWQRQGPRQRPHHRRSTPATRAADQPPSAHSSRPWQRPAVPADDGVSAAAAALTAQRSVAIAEHHHPSRQQLEHAQPAVEQQPAAARL